MGEFSKYVGLDVHKETIAVAVAEAKGGEVRYLGDIANPPEAIDKLVRQLRKNGATLSFCYEAGPCGYGLHRQLTALVQEYVDTVTAMGKRVAALDAQLESAAMESAFWPVIEGLMALRGVNLLTATTIVAEIGDLKRFANAPQLMAYLGMVPSEHSSGGTKSRGAITKTGNGHVRRVLVEAAWAYRHPAGLLISVGSTGAAS